MELLAVFLYAVAVCLVTNSLLALFNAWWRGPVVKIRGLYILDDETAYFEVHHKHGTPYIVTGDAKISESE